MSDYFDHSFDDVQVGGECRFCPNPIPYLQEDVVVPLYQLFDQGGVYTVCFDCFEIAESGAQPENVKRSFKISTIVAV